MHCVVNSIEVESLCSLCKISLALSSTILRIYTHLKIFLGGIGKNLTKKFCKFCSMLSFFKSSLCVIVTNLRIAFTISLTNGEYLICRDSDILARAPIGETSSDISGSVIAALNKAGYEKDDVITCVFVYGKASRINDISRMRAAEEKISKLYDNFYCSYIKVPY